VIHVPQLAPEPAPGWRDIQHNRKVIEAAVATVGRAIARRQRQRIKAFPVLGPVKHWPERHHDDHVKPWHVREEWAAHYARLAAEEARKEAERERQREADRRYNGIQWQWVKHPERYPGAD
jgi:hypothetical protein